MTIFTNQTQKDRRAYSDYWGIEIAEVYFCDDCGYWTHNDEDDLPVCKCAQGSTLGDTPDAGPPPCENLQKRHENFVENKLDKWDRQTKLIVEKEKR